MGWRWRGERCCDGNASAPIVKNVEELRGSTEGFAQALEESVRRERDVVLSLGMSRVRSPGSGGSVTGTGVFDSEVKRVGDAEGNRNDHGHGNEGAGGVEGK